MRNLSLNETLLAKSSFEQHANDGGVLINSYRADNGHFADAGFQKSTQRRQSEDYILRSWGSPSKWNCRTEN